MAIGTTRRFFTDTLYLMHVLLLEQEGSAVSTIIVRGSTDNIMDDTERALDDGINTFRTMAKVVCVCLSVIAYGIYQHIRQTLAEVLV